MNGHTLRQAVAAALTANALRPLDTPSTATPAFAAGWLTGELAPQLLGLVAADTTLSALRHRVSPAGLALAAASAGGLAWMTSQALRSDLVLAEALGDLPAVERERTALATLARPFASLRDPAVRVERDVAYTEGGRRALLDVYRPVVPEGTDATGAPVLVQIHGGAWTIGSKEQQGLLLMNRMASLGWVCVSVNYRLAPRHQWPAQIDDVRRALAWVHEHIGEYGGDASHLALTGGSAGGHLSALAALTSEVPVAACVPFYGIYDMAADDAYGAGLRRFLTWRRVFGQDSTLEDFREASPLHHIGPDAPDFFVIHGAHDTLVSVSQARAFVEALRATSRNTVAYAELPGAQHAFDVFGSIRAHHAVRAAARWLEWQRSQRTQPTPA